MEDEEEDILSVINNLTAFPTQQEQEVEEEEEDEVLGVVNNEEKSKGIIEESADLVRDAFDFEEDLLSSDPTSTVVSNLSKEGNDITFNEFNNTPEEDLQELDINCLVMEATGSQVSTRIY